MEEKRKEIKLHLSHKNCYIHYMKFICKYVNYYYTFVCLFIRLGFIAYQPLYVI